MVFSEELKDEGTNLERVRNLSDGVFSIVLTLLVLNLNIPKLAEVENDRELWAALLRLGPVLIGYIVSFFLIGIYWISHIRVFRHIVRYNRRLLFLNLVFLFWVSVLPFTTTIDAAKPDLPLAWTLYATSVSMAGLSIVAIWGRAKKDKMLDHSVSASLWSYILARILLMPVVMGMSIPLSYLHIGSGWVHLFPATTLIGLAAINRFFSSKVTEKV